jgi:predicted helicase
MSETIDFYNQQKELYRVAKLANSRLLVEEFIDADPQKISWTRSLRRDAGKNIEHVFNSSVITSAYYRPFFKQFLYLDKAFIESPGLSQKFFPDPSFKNLIISVTGEGNLGFSMLMVDKMPDLCFTKTGNGGGQAFPLYYYEENKSQTQNLFDEPILNRFIRRDGISDFILFRAHKIYGKNVTKEDIFYYVYGLLHSSEYREVFSNDLKKMLPHLPLLEDVRDFWKFSKAGRELAELHINYEQLLPYNGVVVKGRETGHFTVDKMKFPKRNEKDCIIYNPYISVESIPAKAYGYTVNGKSAIEWIMERYQVTTHKESGIVNNPNDWAAEVGKPAYILDLLLSIIAMSVRTVEIVEGLPKVDFSTL